MYQEREISNEKELKVEHIETSSLILNMAQMRSAGYLMPLCQAITRLDRDKIIFESVRREIDARGNKTKALHSDTSKAKLTARDKGKAKEVFPSFRQPQNIPIQCSPLVASAASLYSHVYPHPQSFDSRNTYAHPQCSPSQLHQSTYPSLGHTTTHPDSIGPVHHFSHTSSIPHISTNVQHLPDNPLQSSHVYPSLQSIRSFVQPRDTPLSSLYHRSFSDPHIDSNYSQ